MDTTKNQSQVREAVLKVFRGSTTSQCADIIVDRRTPTISKTAGVKTATETFYKYNLYDSDDVMISCGTTTPEKQTTREKIDVVKQAKDRDNPVARCQHRHLRDASHKTCYQKEKRRRSRAERNKTRACQKQKQVDPHERTEFRKHVKRAKEISLHSRTDKVMQQTQQTSIITQGRLTRPIGIYNKGKKSDKVYRAPLFVSDRVKEAVEKDLKKILSTSDRPLRNAPSFDDSLGGSAGPSITPVFSMEKRASQLPSVGSVPRSHNKMEDDKQKANTDEEFPKDPPLKEVSLDLMDSLRSDIEMAFPGRDYFKELQEDLLKMMKRNSICHSISSGGDNCSASSGVDAILTAKEEERNHAASSDSSIHPSQAQSTYIPDHSTEAEPTHGATVYSLSQESTGLDLRQYQPHKDLVPTITHTAYTADGHKRAVDSITDTLPFLRRTEEIEQTRESVSKDQPAGSCNGWQVLPSNRPTDQSTYKWWGVSKDTSVGAFEKIPAALRDLQENAQHDWQARSNEGLIESTGGWHSSLRDAEAGLSERLAGQSNRHLDWRTDCHDICQQQAPRHSTRDILDVISSSHQLHPSHYQQDHPYFLSSHSQEKPDRVVYNPYQGEAPSRHHLQDEQMWFFEEQKLARGNCYADYSDLHDFQSSESERHSWKGQSGQLKREMDCDPAFSIWCKSYVSPLQKPRLESPSPPKHYPQRMY